MKIYLLQYLQFSFHVTLFCAPWSLSEKEHPGHKWGRIKFDCDENMCRILYQATGQWRDKRNKAENLYYSVTA
jgi:hypothetical protein